MQSDAGRYPLLPFLAPFDPIVIGAFELLINVNFAPAAIWGVFWALDCCFLRKFDVELGRALHNLLQLLPCQGSSFSTCYEAPVVGIDPLKLRLNWDAIAENEFGEFVGYSVCCD